MKIIELTGTTDASGDLTITSTENVVGNIEKVIMDYDDGDTGADLTLTNESVTSEAVLSITDAGTSDLVWYPRNLGSKVADGTSGSVPANKIFVTGKFKIVIAQGGNAKNFRFMIYVSDE